MEGHETTSVDTPALIAELWELSNGGTAEWWANEDGYKLVYDDDYDEPWLYMNDEYEGATLKAQHALDIIRGHAERWLLERRWNSIRLHSSAKAMYWIPVEKSDGISLADALRAEMGRGG